MYKRKKDRQCQEMQIEAMVEPPKELQQQLERAFSELISKIDREGVLEETRRDMEADKILEEMKCELDKLQADRNKYGQYYEECVAEVIEDIIGSYEDRVEAPVIERVQKAYKQGRFKTEASFDPMGILVELLSSLSTNI